MSTDRAGSELHAAIHEAVLRIAGQRPSAIASMPGGASIRRYHRVTVAGGQPSSLVVMELGESPASEEVAKAGAGPAAELPFLDVLDYLQRGDIAVPRVYHFDRARGLIYLEDLGDDTLESRVLDAGDDVRRSYYRRAIAELVRIQTYAAQHPTGCIAFSRGFDVELLKWELDHFREWGLEAGAGAALTVAERAELERQFQSIAERLAAEPRLFVHRDYQSRNLMIQGQLDDARVRPIDFQDALLGTRVYDLVALLRDSYVVLSPALVSGLVADYAATTASDEKTTRALFDLQTVQRKLKDAGRFVFIDRVKKNPSFLQWIPSSHGYVVDALARLPELASVREIVGRYIPAFRA